MDAANFFYILNALELSVFNCCITVQSLNCNYLDLASKKMWGNPIMNIFAMCIVQIYLLYKRNIIILRWCSLWNYKYSKHDWTTFWHIVYLTISGLFAVKQFWSLDVTTFSFLVLKFVKYVDRWSLNINYSGSFTTVCETKLVLSVFMTINGSNMDFAQQWNTEFWNNFCK